VKITSIAFVEVPSMKLFKFGYFKTNNCNDSLKRFGNIRKISDLLKLEKKINLGPLSLKLPIGVGNFIVILVFTN
jgi:hypothetical protein